MARIALQGERKKVQGRYHLADRQKGKKQFETRRAISEGIRKEVMPAKR